MEDNAAHYMSLIYLKAYVTINLITILIRSPDVYYVGRP